MLDAAAKDHWARNGWLWLRGFLGAAEVQDLRRWTDEIATWPEVPGRWMRYYERRAGDPRARMLARIENFVPYHSGLAGVVTSPRLMDLLAALCGEPVVLFKDKVNFKLPGGAGFSPHQDAPAYVDGQHDRQVVLHAEVDVRGRERLPRDGARCVRARLPAAE